jgi:hypothetical protein
MLLQSHRQLLCLGDENRLWDFLLSNDPWGGAGSVADQALLELLEERRLLDYSTEEWCAWVANRCVIEK